MPGLLDSRLHVHSDGYSPSMSEQLGRHSVVDSKGYNKERVLDRSWLQLEQKPVEFFWERGFWAEIFGDKDSESASSSMVRQFELHRLAVVSEPVVDDIVDADVETSGCPQKRMRTSTYMDVVSKSSVQSWREHRDSMWEVAIRRWHSSAMTWKGDDCFIQMLQAKQDLRGQTPWNVAFCGMVLFCVYGRARWSDAQHSQFIEWDADSDGNLCFVECSTAVHKTCRSLNMRHAFLPVTAIGKGVTDSCCAAYWQRSRLELDIEDLSVFPLMPAPDEGGAPTVRPLSTAEAGKWLHLILQQQCAKMDMQSPLKYASHSFKATCLSYLAKFGCSFEDRFALGYHTDQVRMALRYSRDGARPLRVLEDCITAIRGKTFLP
eukprot:s3503_g8.t1